MPVLESPPLRLAIPDSYRAAFDMLAARGVLAPDLAYELSAAASLRNRIARGYASVEHERRCASSRPGSGLDTFASAVAA